MEKFSEDERNRRIKEYLLLSEDCLKKANMCLKESEYYAKDASMFLEKANALKEEETNVQTP